MTIGRFVSLCCAAILLTGCQRDSGDATADSPIPHKHSIPVKRGPSPDELTVGMVEAVTEGKSAVPVGLKFELTERPVVGRLLQLSVAVMPQIVADWAVLEAVGSTSLKLAPGMASIEIPSVDPTQVYRHSIELTPLTEGIQLLALKVTMKHDDGTESRTFSVPLIVAGAEEAAAAGTPTSRSGHPPEN